MCRCGLWRRVSFTTIENLPAVVADGWRNFYTRFCEDAGVRSGLFLPERSAAGEGSRPTLRARADALREILSLPQHRLLRKLALNGFLHTSVQIPA